MLKYGCYCINCQNQTPQGTCTVESIVCAFHHKDGRCPVTNCMMFKVKKKPAQDPCVYFADIEKSGLSMLY